MEAANVFCANAPIPVQAQQAELLDTLREEHQRVHMQDKALLDAIHQQDQEQNFKDIENSSIMSAKVGGSAFKLPRDSAQAMSQLSSQLEEILELS